MSTTQENYDRALTSGHLTLRELCLASEVDGMLLEDKPVSMLKTMAHDLESILMCLNQEINTRPGAEAPVDWG